MYVMIWHLHLFKIFDKPAGPNYPIEKTKVILFLAARAALYLHMGLTHCTDWFNIHHSERSTRQCASGQITSNFQFREIEAAMRIIVKILSMVVMVIIVVMVIMVAKVIMVTKVTFELNFPGNLLLAAFAILTMFRKKWRFHSSWEVLEYMLGHKSWSWSLKDPFLETNSVSKYHFRRW